MRAAKIILTGSEGYVGTATKELLYKQGYEVIEIDKKNNTDTRDTLNLIKLCKNKPKAIIHLSAKKSIPESKEKPLQYYFNNLISTLSIAIVSRIFSIPVVFASSAAVYMPSNPYARSKILEEKLLGFLCPSVAVLRYFNVVGKTSTVKDEGSTNIFSVIKQNPTLEINSITSTRDYVNVLDIARANVLALEYIKNNKSLTTDIFTGEQRTLMDVLTEYKRHGQDIEYKVLGIDDMSINPSLDNRSILGWRPVYTFEEGILSEIVYK